MRVVVTAPTDLPAAFASSSSVGTALPLPLVGQVVSAPLMYGLTPLYALVSAVMEMTSLFIFTPVM